MPSWAHFVSQGQPQNGINGARNEGLFYCGTATLISELQLRWVFIDLRDLYKSLQRDVRDDKKWSNTLTRISFPNNNKKTLYLVTTPNTGQFGISASPSRKAGASWLCQGLLSLGAGSRVLPSHTEGLGCLPCFYTAFPSWVSGPGQNCFCCGALAAFPQLCKGTSQLWALWEPSPNPKSVNSHTDLPHWIQTYWDPQTQGAKLFRTVPPEQR